MKRSTLALLAVAFGVASGAWAGLAPTQKIPAGRLMQGYMAQRSGEYALAIDNYKTALKEDPDSVEIRLRLVRLYTVFGEMDQALRVLDDGLERRTDQPELLFTKAKTMLMANRNAEAAEAAEKAAQKGAGARAYGLAVRLLDSMGQRDRALALAEKWVAEAPADPEAQYQLGIELERFDRAPEAEKAYRKALSLKADFHPALQGLAGLLARGGKRDEAIRLYKDLIAANPHDEQAYLFLSELLIEAGQPEKARENLAAAEKWIKGPAQVILRMGLLYMDLGEPDAALRVIETIPEEERDERTWFFLGAARMGLDKYDKAVEAFDRIPVSSPIYTEGFIRRAQALKELGRGDQAVADLRRWTAAHPEDAEAVLALAGLFQSLERNKEAVELLDGFRAKTDSKDARVYFALGASFDKLGDFEKSTDMLRKAIEIDPNHAHALNYLGYLYADKGIHLDEAEKLIRRAVEILPQNGFILDSLGWVFFKQHKLGDAKDALEKSLKTAPEDSIIWEHLGDVLVALGDKDRARDAYEKASKLKNPSPGLKEKLTGVGGK